MNKAKEKILNAKLGMFATPKSCDELIGSFTDLQEKALASLVLGQTWNIAMQYAAETITHFEETKTHIEHNCVDCGRLIKDIDEAVVYDEANILCNECLANKAQKTLRELILPMMKSGDEVSAILEVNGMGRVLTLNCYDAHGDLGIVEIPLASLLYETQA